MKINYQELLENLISDVQSAAVSLAMTNTINAENNLKILCENNGYKCAVTEFGGSQDEISKKIISSIIGAALNKRIIVKEDSCIHAVIHAAEEAARGFFISPIIKTNVAVKVAIVRNDKWIAVAFSGFSAFYHCTNHRRICVGLCIFKNVFYKK